MRGPFIVSRLDFSVLFWLLAKQSLRQGFGCLWLMVGGPSEERRKQATTERVQSKDVVPAEVWPQPDPQGALEHKLYHRTGPTLRQRCCLCTPVSISYWLWADCGEGLSSGGQVAAILLKPILWRRGSAVGQYSQQLWGVGAPAWQRASGWGPIVWTNPP